MYDDGPGRKSIPERYAYLPSAEFPNIEGYKLGLFKDPGHLKHAAARRTLPPASSFNQSRVFCLVTWAGWESGIAGC